MSRTPRHIAVLYSKGPHLTRLLHSLRKTYPDANISVLLPEGYPKKNLETLADMVLYVRSVNSLCGRFKILTTVRAMQADMLVVMFPSAKLRIFSRLSGCPQQYCYSVNGQFIEVRVNLITEFANLVASRIQGIYAWCKIKVYISRHRIGK